MQFFILCMLVWMHILVSKETFLYKKNFKGNIFLKWTKFIQIIIIIEIEYVWLIFGLKCEIYKGTWSVVFYSSGSYEEVISEF